MKKLLFAAAILAAIAPGLFAGIETTEQIHGDRRDAMLEERFKAFCASQGVSYYGMTAKERDSYYLDVWTEFDDYFEAVDSIDSVLSAERRAYILGK